MTGITSRNRIMETRRFQSEKGFSKTFKVHVDQPLCVNARVVPWFRRLVTGLSQQRPEFVPSSLYLGFAVDDVV
jgi:hypothetical protein